MKTGESPTTKGSLLRARPSPQVTVDTYPDDPLYPKVSRVVASILTREKIVAPTAVLVGMGLLKPTDLESWQRGQVPYLEYVIDCNLTRLSRLLRILRFHAHDLNLQPKRAEYRRIGARSGPLLRFTKTGDKRLEEAYSTHLVWPGKNLPAVTTVTRG
jgi:hypothetical protein